MEIRSSYMHYESNDRRDAVRVIPVAPAYFVDNANGERYFLVNLSISGMALATQGEMNLPANMEGIIELEQLDIVVASATRIYSNDKQSGWNFSKLEGDARQQIEAYVLHCQKHARRTEVAAKRIIDEQQILSASEIEKTSKD